MPGELTIKIESGVDNCTFEILEDKIRDLLESEGLMGEIEDKVTGNTTRTRKEELCAEKDGTADVLIHISEFVDKGIEDTL